MSNCITTYCSIKINPADSGRLLLTTPNGVITEINDSAVLYSKQGMDYPKFFKMDQLAKFGILAAEALLFRGWREKYRDSEIAVVLSGKNGSLATDLQFHKTIEHADTFFPSPAIFVYTLANIVMGEICIRHHIKGENFFFVAEEFNAALLHQYVSGLFKNNRAKACITGWVDYFNDRPEIVLALIENNDLQPSKTIEFNITNLAALY